MKVNLVVATGVHQGKAIPVPAAQLLIGRDPECQLRPASPAVSKKHCQISIRDGKVFVADMGSTNGTFINDVQLTGEAPVEDGDRLRLGPLDFIIQVKVEQPKTDSTPLPETLKALPKGGRLSDGIGVKPIPPLTPAKPKPESGEMKAAAPETKPAAAETKPVAKLPPARGDDADALAAMLLSEGDEEAGVPSVPDGSTVTDLPIADLERIRQSGQDSGGKKKPVAGVGDSSKAANDLLKQYFKRPK